MNHFLTPRELAERLRVSRATLYRRMEEGLPYLQVGSQRRFDETEVMDWLKTRGKADDPPLPPGVYSCCCGWTANADRPFRASEARCPKCGAVGKVRAVT